MSDICAICHDSLDGEDQVHTLSCNHCFHTGCVLHWFRRGAQTCPTCRDTDYNTTEKIGGLTLRARARYLRRKTRNKNCPPELLKIVTGIRKAEDKSKKARKEYFDFQKENALILKKIKIMRSKMYHNQRKIRDKIMVLGLFQDETMQLPLLQICQENPNDFRMSLSG